MEADDMPIEDGIDSEKLADDIIEIESEIAFEVAERSDRAWLRTLYPILDLITKSDKCEMNNRVQYALDDAAIAASERIARICRSDIPKIFDEVEIEEEEDA